MMEYAEYFDFGSVGLVVVDDVLLCLEAATSGKEIVPMSTRLWVPREHFKSLNYHDFVPCLLLGAPSASRVQQDV